MKSQSKTSPTIRSFLRNFFALIIAFLVLLITSCTEKPEPYSVLEFTGKAEVYNYSKALLPIIIEADSAAPAALLAEEGDLILYGEKYCLWFDKLLQGTFSVRTTENVGYINDKISSIIIPKNNDLVSWFEDVKSFDFSGLGFIFLDSVVSEKYIPYLKDIAKTRPNIGLGFDGELSSMSGVLKIFNPAFLVGVSLPQKDFGVLSGLKNLEILCASLPDSVYTEPLPAVPELEQLILTDVHKNSPGNDFLINNRQIEKLTLMKPRKLDFKMLEPLENLKELIINNPDTILNIKLLENHKNLELLSIICDEIPNELSLKELQSLRWMAFYEIATQSGFDSFIGSHPGLEVVELINNDTIKSLKPLLNLGKLSALTVTDKLTDFTAVKSLKSLKYLSLPEEVLKDSLAKADLQQSLPGTRIVANHGICLGTGWLLLIFPFVLILRALIIRRPLSNKR